jgi:hypothetical protein
VPNTGYCGAEEGRHGHCRRVCRGIGVLYGLKGQLAHTPWVYSGRLLGGGSLREAVRRAFKDERRVGTKGWKWENSDWLQGIDIKSTNLEAQ